MKITLFSILAVVAILGATSVAEATNLRSSPALEAFQAASSAAAIATMKEKTSNKDANETKDSDEHLEGVGTQVTIHGAEQVPEEDNAAVLAKCFVSSYNGKNDKHGFKMESFTPHQEVDVPEPDDSDADDAGEDDAGDRQGAAPLVGKRRPRYTNYSWGYSNYWGCGNQCGNDSANWYYGDMPPITFFTSIEEDPSASEVHEEFERDLCECLKASGLKSYAHAKDCDVEYLYSYGNAATIAMNHHGGK